MFSPWFRGSRREITVERNLIPAPTGEKGSDLSRQNGMKAEGRMRGPVVAQAGNHDFFNPPYAGKMPALRCGQLLGPSAPFGNCPSFPFQGQDGATGGNVFVSLPVLPILFAINSE